MPMLYISSASVNIRNRLWAVESILSYKACPLFCLSGSRLSCTSFCWLCLLVLHNARTICPRHFSSYRIRITKQYEKVMFISYCWPNLADWFSAVLCCLVSCSLLFFCSQFPCQLCEILSMLQLCCTVPPQSRMFQIFSMWIIFLFFLGSIITFCTTNVALTHSLTGYLGKQKCSE